MGRWERTRQRGNQLLALLPDEGEHFGSGIRVVVPHLDVLERYGIEQVGGAGRSSQRPPPGAAQDVIDATQAVFALGADRATRLGAPEPGETALVMASLHGAAGSNFDQLNALVGERARAKAEKLAAGAGDERHLFVWMRSSVADAELAMAALPPPESTPTLPKGIDVVWVATGPERAGALCGRLWRLEPPGGWEQIAA
jgi:hypothetical protein